MLKHEVLSAIVREPSDLHLPLTPVLKKLATLGFSHCGQMRFASFDDSVLEAALAKYHSTAKKHPISSPFGYLLKQCNDIATLQGKKPDYKYAFDLADAYGYDQSTPTMAEASEITKAHEELGYTYGSTQKSTQSKDSMSGKAFVWTDSGRKALAPVLDESYLQEPAEYVLPALGEAWDDHIIIGPMDFIDNIATLPLSPDVRTLAAELFAKKAIAAIYTKADWNGNCGFIANEAGMRRGGKRPEAMALPLQLNGARMQTSMLKMGHSEFMRNLAERVEAPEVVHVGYVS